MLVVLHQSHGQQHEKAGSRTDRHTQTPTKTKMVIVLDITIISHVIYQVRVQIRITRLQRTSAAEWNYLSEETMSTLPNTGHSQT